MTQTPMQELIKWLEEWNYDEAAYHAKKVFLPKEREFAERIWDKGEDFGVWLKSDNTHYPKQVQTKQQFINQLYPEK